MRGRRRQRLGGAARSETGATWSHRRLAAVLIAAVVAGLLAVAGLGMAVYYTLRPGKPTAAGHPAAIAHLAGSERAVTAAGAQRAAEDDLAARPMPTVGLAAARPGPVSTRDPGVLLVPAATRIGAAGVPSGFPHTPEGALAQLAAIDQTAMQSGTLAGVRAVIAQWAAPGGPDAQSWSGLGAMASFLSAAGLSGGGSGRLALVVTPLMGLIKGTVGSDFVLACVDMQFDVTLASTQQVAVADCQRMVWRGERWLIGPGPEPAPAPSVWPDTDAAIDAGYRDLRRG